MFNLFRKSKTVQPKEVSVLEPQSGYPAIVEEIHNEFNLAGERLLKEAKTITDNIAPTNEAKAKVLADIGFVSTKEVLETQKALELKKQKEELSVALEYFSTKYPQYKFISTEMAEAICKKYDLVLGEVGQYTGFVPEKNLAQITKFFEVENDINVQYVRRLAHSFMSWQPTTKDYYEKHIESEKMRKELGYITCYHEFVQKIQSQLSICAPLKDMKTDGYKLHGRIFKREIPDPVVLAPVKHGNIDLYCIITAWGTESTDENVVNEKMN